MIKYVIVCAQRLVLFNHCLDKLVRPSLQLFKEKY